ncbi:lysoplasmalogenase family protein [Alkaliphilus flagellatus]|uniref:lysoplasmalogenase family protein n=1 Tax=Alkaliphilus flagellatus TaxID=2841507 RepID=UPI0038CBF96F
MKYRKKELFLKILLITICILYILFLYIDIFNIQDFISSDILKYISIIFCFLITLILGENCLDKKDISLLQTGLFITVFADLFLLILDYYILGITLFCFVQIIYYIRYKGYRDSFTIVRFIIIFLFIMAVYFTLNIFIIKIDFILAIAFFYSICLMTSTIEAIKAFKNNLYPYPNNYMVLWGMIFFFLCDINVAISNLTREIFVPLYNISILLIWFFYLPSQILLSISGNKFKENKK